MNAKCTDAKPCNLTTCYGCARKLIDDLAGHMLDQGASQDKVDAFRYPAINALATHVITVPAPPKPKATKAFTPRLGTNYQDTVTYLRSATSRDDAAWTLVGLTMAEMKHVWVLAGRTDRIPTGLRRMELIAYLVDHLVGYRLDSEAIRTGAQS